MSSLQANIGADRKGVSNKRLNSKWSCWQKKRTWGCFSDLLRTPSIFFLPSPPTRLTVRVQVLEFTPIRRKPSTVTPARPSAQGLITYVHTWLGDSSIDGSYNANWLIDSLPSAEALIKYVYTTFHRLYHFPFYQLVENEKLFFIHFFALWIKVVENYLSSGKMLNIRRGWSIDILWWQGADLGWFNLTSLWFAESFGSSSELKDFALLSVTH